MEIRVAVCGAGGRMSGEVVSLILEQKDMILVAALEAPGHPAVGKEVGPVSVSEDLRAGFQAADVVVDFSTPSGALKIAETCRELRKPLVTGTTGFTSEEMAKLEEIAEEVPLCHAPNMALGMHLLFRLVREAALKLPDFDIEVMEMHHGMKKDAPSGSALRILDILKECKEDAALTYGRKGMVGQRKKEEIGIHSLRGGDVVGLHTIIFSGNGESMEITHRAVSRKAFANGTLKAIRFLAGAEKGLYNMSDLF